MLVDAALSAAPMKAGAIAPRIADIHQDLRPSLT
jgi:hypothetical protein